MIAPTFDKSTTIGFIGAGAVGGSLAVALQGAGYPVVAVASRTPASADRFAARIPGCVPYRSLQRLVDSARFVFITTSAAILFDLGLVTDRIRPDADAGRAASEAASDGVTMLDSMALITAPDFEETQARAGENTTIGIVATNADLTKAQANKLASAAHDGLAMAVRPAHLMSDGDTIFSLATRQRQAPANMNRLCAAAALCVSRAIVRGVRAATGIGGVKAVSELKHRQSGGRHMNVDEAARELRRMYDRGARLGETATHVHLFGIKYANELCSLSLSEVVRRAGIPKYAVEINKGRNLAKYVQIKPDVEL